MAELLSSKVVPIEEPPRLRTIGAQPTAVSAMQGVCEMGPVRVPTLVTSFGEAVDKFGGYISASKFMAMVEHAFLNAGDAGLQLYISRVVHYTSILDNTTKTSAAGTVPIPDVGLATTMSVNGKTDGAYINTFDAVVSNPTSGAITEYTLSILRNGAVVEVFSNVTNAAGLPNTVDTVVNAASGSKYVSVTRTLTTRPTNGTYGITGGNDGLAGLADTDYTGSAAGGTGFYAFAQTQGIRLIAAPDRATPAVQAGLVDYASITRGRSMFPVVTFPDGLNKTAVVTWAVTTAQVYGRDENGTMYWKSFKIRNPSVAIFGTGETIVIPNSPAFIGCCARNDGARPGGIYDEPAGVERGKLIGVVALEDDESLDESARDYVYPKNINPISTFPGAPFFFDGVRCLKTDFNFPTVAQRRGVTFIETSLVDGLQVYRFRANDEETRDEVNRTIFAFLLIQWRQRAFRGSTPETSFFVDTSEQINSPSEVQARRLNVRIGLATQSPIEFLILRFSQDLRDVEAELAAA